VSLPNFSQAQGKAEVTSCLEFVCEVKRLLFSVAFDIQAIMIAKLFKHEFSTDTAAPKVSK
jgi:hypothetical protein